jgi:hypothetical protein
VYYTYTQYVVDVGFDVYYASSTTYWV